MNSAGDPGVYSPVDELATLMGEPRGVPIIQGTILLVEDNADEITLTLRAFSKNKITNHIEVARDGEEALQYLLPDDGTDPAPLPMMVLLDINLPQVNGLEVLRRIRSHERTKHLPVVVLTTSSEERDIVESYNLGANSYVRKPVVFDSFSDAVRVLGLYWLLVNESAPRPCGAN
jgi:CheY-like chemotaxis protein